MLITVARTGEVAPGQVQAFELHGEVATAVERSAEPLLRATGWRPADPPRITLANVSGTFYAIDDTCTHMGCSLGDGHLFGSVVQCACHGSRFDVTNGAVVGGPAERPVQSYPTRVAGDEVQVEL